MTPLS